MNETKKSVNTTETEKEYIPDFVKVGEFSIQDRKSLKKFDCRLSNQVRAACNMYKFYSFASSKAGKKSFIERLFYYRVTEYLVKHELPNAPNMFDNYVPYQKHYKGDNYIGDRVLFPNMALSDDRARIIVKLFTTSDIKIAIAKCKINVKTQGEFAKEWGRIKEEITATANKNSDLFNEETKTSNNKDDSLYSTLFCGVDKSDFIKLRERCKLIRNIVHLYTCNNIEFERLLSETEKATNNYLLEKDKQEIKSCLDLDNVPPEMIKEILKFIKGNKGSLK